MATILKITKALELFRLRHKSIKIGLTPEDASHEMENLTKKVKCFEETSNALAEADGVKTNANVISAIKNGKLEITLSALDSVLLEKYKSQVRVYNSFEELKTFLESIFCSVLTNDEKLENAPPLSNH